MRKSGLPAIFVFIAPPSMEELERRLRGRGTEGQDQVETRLKNAYAEMARWVLLRGGVVVGLKCLGRLQVGSGLGGALNSSIAVIFPMSAWPGGGVHAA